jgi:hypothetical protein
MPPITTNQSPDFQTMPYPQTSPLPCHRPTRPTAVVPPLPKDPVISSPIGSMTTLSSIATTPSTYQQEISPQKPSQHKQVNHVYVITFIH